MKVMSDLKPCPFCGETPDFPEVWYGTQYEIECDCGMARSCIQISDLMTIEERETGWIQADSRYDDQYVLRARAEAIKNWNTRQHDKARYIEAVKAHKWSEEYDLNSHQQSENRAIDRAIAAIEAVE
jgi:hypothetical protein